MIQRLVPAYVEALEALKSLGVPEVQVYPLARTARCILSCVILNLSLYFYSLHCIICSLVHTCIFLEGRAGLKYYHPLLHLLFWHSFCYLHPPPSAMRPAFPLPQCCFAYGSFGKDPWLIWKALLIFLGEERGSNPRGH